MPAAAFALLDIYIEYAFQALHPCHRRAPFGNGKLFQRFLPGGFAAFTALSGSYQSAVFAIGREYTVKTR